VLIDEVNGLEEGGERAPFLKRIFVVGLHFIKINEP